MELFFFTLPESSPKPDLPPPVQNVPTNPENVQPTPVVNEPSPSSTPPLELPEPSDAPTDTGGEAVSPEVPSLKPPSPEEPSESPSDLPLKPPGDTSYLNDDMLTQLDMNTESIDTLIARVSSLETKEKELESAMGTISEGLERIEKKLGKSTICEQATTTRNFLNKLEPFTEYDSLNQSKL